MKMGITSPIAISGIHSPPVTPPADLCYPLLFESTIYSPASTPSSFTSTVSDNHPRQHPPSLAAMDHNQMGRILMALDDYEKDTMDHVLGPRYRMLEDL